MKRLALILAILLTAGLAQAQIGLLLESNHQAYLRYEPIRLRVTMTNQSGNTLVFGGNIRDGGRLNFNISAMSGRYIRHRDLSANPLSNLILSPGESKTLYVRLNTLFDLQREDTYTITAVVSHNRLDTKYQSRPISIDVRDGLVMGKRTIGLPSANAADMIQKIQFVLLRFRDVAGSLYCLRAEDDQKVYGTFRIGPYIMGALKPQMEIENGNTLHVLLQVAPRLYCYTTYSVRKHEIKKRQEVYYTAAPGGTPHLSRETGFLKVHNVKLALLGRDFEKEADQVFGDE